MPSALLSVRALPPHPARRAAQVAGVDELGTVGRGNAMEIGTYVERMLASELSGNIVDLCPVGALTSKPYAFTARPWELRSTESIDVLDGLGSNIRIDTRGGEVMRILPRLNEDINEEWISDKTRFAYDGLKRQRLDSPLVRPDPELPLQPASWKDALALVAHKLKSTPGARIAAYAGALSDAESMLALKDLLNSFNADSVFCDVAAGLSPDCRAAYTLGSTIAGVEEADAVLLLSTDLKREAPLLNARLRRRVFHDGVRVASVGPNVPLTYEYEHLGDSVAQLLELANGTHPFCEVLAGAQKPLVLVGTGAFERRDASGVAWAVQKLVTSVPALLQPGWNGFGTVQPTAAAVGALDLGLTPLSHSPPPAGASGAPSDALSEPYELVFLLGYDAIDLDRLSPDAFVVYQVRRPRGGGPYLCRRAVLTRSACRRPVLRARRATTATLARRRRTSCCPAPPTPRRWAPTPTWRGARSAPRARSRRPARRATTGRCCAPSRSSRASRCPTPRTTACTSGSRPSRRSSPTATRPSTPSRPSSQRCAPHGARRPRALRATAAARGCALALTSAARRPDRAARPPARRQCSPCPPTPSSTLTRRLRLRRAFRTTT